MADEIPPSFTVVPVKEPKKNRLIEFFQEDNGGLSMTRLLTFLIIVVPLLGWLLISLYHWALTDYPGGVLSLQFGALGSKLIQKSQEEKITTPPPPQTTTP